MSPPPWRIRLSTEAEADFAAILRWTWREFGARQEQRYRQLLLLAVRSLQHGPSPFGSMKRDEVLPGLRNLHISRSGRRSRHFLLYRAISEEDIEILRILHDSMDLPQHIRGGESTP